MENFTCIEIHLASALHLKGSNGGHEVSEESYRYKVGPETASYMYEWNIILDNVDISRKPHKDQKSFVEQLDFTVKSQKKTENAI